MDFGGNRFWRHCRDSNSTPWNAAGTRRRRICLCRPAHVARHPSIQARLQHEVSRNLCCVCRDYVNVWTNNPWDSLGAALSQCCHDRADFLPGPTPDEFDGGNRRSNELCRSLCESIRPWVGCSRDAFCNAARAWWDAAPSPRTESARVRPTIRKRIAVWHRRVDEAARRLFYSVWSNLPSLE